MMIEATKSDVEWLTEYWKEFCEENRLPLISAEELLIEYGNQMPVELRNKVKNFIDSWETYV